MSKVILIIIALFLPPLAVFMRHGLNSNFWINVVLCLFGYLPGQIHALYLIAVE